MSKTLYQIVDSNNDTAAVGYDGNLFGTEQEAQDAITELAVSNGWDVTGLRVVEVSSDDEDVRSHPMFGQYA